MGSIINEKAHHSTIYSVWRKIEKYWDEIVSDTLTVKPESFLNPLDALLTDVILGFSLKKAVINDHTWSQTAGILSIVALTSDQTKKVIGHSSPSKGSPVTPEIFKTFTGNYQLLSKWKWDSHDDSSDHFPNQTTRFHFRLANQPDLIQSIGSGLQTDSSAIFLIFGLGKQGNSTALEDLILLVDERNELELVRAQELGPCFHDSGLGIVYSKANSDAALILDRIRIVYTSNFEMEEMIKLAHSHWVTDRQMDKNSAPKAKANPVKSSLVGPMKT